jgi:hypothetical protein
MATFIKQNNYFTCGRMVVCHVVYALAQCLLSQSIFSSTAEKVKPIMGSISVYWKYLCLAEEAV